ncbi:MAG: ThiF family adenylyltransferase [Flavobacteriales bacterium]
MAAHLRFKRHLRFLRDGETMRVVQDLAKDAELPAGEAFDHLLAAVEPSPDEQVLRLDLSRRMNAEPSMVDGLLTKLFALKLIERFDPADRSYVRFDRQLLLLDALAPADDQREVLARQKRLDNAHVMVLGLGGIGHQVALSLAAAGVGKIILVDGDVVEESNLHRQILFAAMDVGRSKVEAARDGLLRVAPGCGIAWRKAMVHGAEEWEKLIASFPGVRHVVISADKPVQLVNWISDARKRFNYHCIKCGYMATQGLIGPLLGPETKGYDELFSSWGPLIEAQSENIRTFNARSIAPTMAASNAIMANMAALELIKHITRAGTLTLVEKRMLLDLNTYSTQLG